MRAFGSAAPRRRSLRWLAPIVALLALGAPFIGAGTLAWPMAWLYTGLTTVWSIAGRVLMLRAHPELAAERTTFLSNEGTKSWDRVLAPLVIAGPLVSAFVAGLNRRFGWQPAVSRTLQASALAVMAGCLGFASWAMVSNPFFSSVVRIQTGRDHHAIDNGPYRFVRHPGYAGSLFAQFAVAIVLGSAWALIPAALVAALIVLRTALEDRALLAELTGYRVYAARVHHRLLPGIW